MDKSKYFNIINHPIATVLKIYIVAILSFFIFRAILFLTELDRINIAEDKIANVILSFVMGIRFDIVISGYILILPILALLTLDVLRIKSKIASKIIFVYIFSLFALAFMICASDIPYFNQFFQRFSVSAFKWMDSPLFVFKMIIQEPRYLIFSILAVALIFLFYALLNKIFKSNETSPLNVLIKVPIYIIVLGIMFLGIRGRLTKKSPIRVGTAYFCDNSFLNQLGLNPVFTLMRSYLDSNDSRNKPISIINSDVAKANVIKYLGIEKQQFNSPIARFKESDTMPIKPNVVVVIMESMSAAKMKRHGNNNNLTPFLDSLLMQSVYFDNIYTAGKHTFNGIFSTIFSFPALYQQHTMKQMRRYNGISGALKKHGYKTIYFSTHDGQFDNVEGFLRNNDFDRVVSLKDYPSKEIKTTLGVPDDYMFRFSIPILNELNSKNAPFLSVFMTASDHGPYYIPEYFSPQAKEIKEQIVQYADWSLKQFIEKASNQSWFRNTIFIFVADHGAPLSAYYDISLDYHHTPLIIYSPQNLVTKTAIGSIGGQIDVFPTIMGVLKLPYINNSLGIDLLNETRPYIIINDNDKIGVLDNEFLLIMKEGEKSKLYKYRYHDRKNYIDEFKEKVNEMEVFAKSNLQVCQDMITNNETYVEQ
ncbi:MAG: LTA synthase family protein [Bacteroidales bacterium]|nr:MAG: LTA synthase family protein [Bacteroidales bacterium]